MLEPLSRDETNTLNTVAEAGALVTHLAASGAKLLVDTHHMACNGEDPQTMLPFVPLIKHAHVAEYQGGYDRRISVECGWQQLQEEAERAVAILRKQWTAASTALTNE